MFSTPCHTQRTLSIVKRCWMLSRCRELSDTEYMEDALILAGDVSDDQVPLGSAAVHKPGLMRKNCTPSVCLRLAGLLLCL